MFALVAALVVVGRSVMVDASTAPAPACAMSDDAPADDDDAPDAAALVAVPVVFAPPAVTRAHAALTSPKLLPAPCPPLRPPIFS
jgi:hypothetical protein